MSEVNFGAGLKRNLEAEYEGAWVELSDGTEIKTRAATYKPFVLKAAKIEKEIKAKGKNAVENEPLRKELNRKLHTLIAKELWVDWAVKDKDGKKVPYSFENLTTIAGVDPADESWNALFSEAFELAQDLANFDADARVEDIKN